MLWEFLPIDIIDLDMTTTPISFPVFNEVHFNLTFLVGILDTVILNIESVRKCVLKLHYYTHEAVKVITFS